MTNKAKPQLVPGKQCETGNNSEFKSPAGYAGTRQRTEQLRSSTSQVAEVIALRGAVEADHPEAVVQRQDLPVVEVAAQRGR